MENKYIKVYVGDVDKNTNQVYLEGQELKDLGLEEQFYDISPPCDIKFMLTRDGKAREGNATVKFNGVGGVCYLKFDAPAQKTFSKPWNKTSSPAQPFQKANQYQQKDVDWDKIALSKCKHAFLIEAFKMNMSLDKAEVLAELWARASVREVPEDAVIGYEVEKARIRRAEANDSTKIPEEDLGEY